MKNTIFTSKQISAGTWLIRGCGCTSYLLVGSIQGVVIDTGYASENIQEYAQSLTDKSVEIAANTHGHFDHTGGNGWFKCAFMSAKALEIAKIPYPSKVDLNLPLDYPVTIVGDGDIIDLGDRTLEVFEIPAHAPSSIAFLDRRERILFSGDEIAERVMLIWQQDEPQPTVEQYVANLEKLMRYRGEFAYIASGHADELQDASLIEDCLENARRIINGEAESRPLDPHPVESGEDAPDPRDFKLYQPEFKRISVWKKSCIGYDVRYIRNK